MGLALSEPINQVTDRCLPRAESVKELPSAGFGDGVESIGRGRSSGHQPSYTDISICQQGAQMPGADIECRLT